jgi:S-formylglutathione hydrolase FrmB
MGISRRTALVSLACLGGLLGMGGSGVALVDAEVIPGKSALNTALGRCDAPQPGPSLRGAPDPPVVGTFRSAKRRREVGYAISYPPGYPDGARLPVCLALHGYQSDARGAVATGDYPAYIAAAVRDGAAPFVLAAVDGGNGYWHPHPTDDPLGMLVDEYLPMLRARGLDTDRVAVTGWSMGGYGALVAALTYRTRFRLAVATSPAIFHSYADAHRVAPEAYDSTADWSAFNVTSRAKEFAGLPVRIATGSGDPFVEAVRTLQTGLPDPAVVEVTTGCHDNRFWSYAAPAQVRAISSALAG